MTIQLAVDALSVAGAVRNADPSLVRVLKLNGLAEVEGVFLPSGIGDVDERIQQFGIRAIDSLPTGTDAIIVVDDADGRRKAGLSRVYVTATDAVELVRLHLLRANDFEIAPQCSIGEWLYYIYRVKKTFPMYQEAWSVAVATERMALPGGVFDQLHSLSLRLTFLCRAADQVSINCLLPPTNSSQDRGLYHLAYFVMLATGVFDDLAWIIANVYSLQLHYKETILRIPDGKPATKLTNALATANPDLHAYITSTHAQARLRLFYPLRDRLQHRAFLDGLHWLDERDGPGVTLYQFPDDAVDLIRAVSSDGTGRDWGVTRLPQRTPMLSMDATVDARRFVATGLTTVAELHDSMLARIDWQSFLVSLTPENRADLNAGLRVYRSTLWRFLKFPCEPLIL